MVSSAGSAPSPLDPKLLFMFSMMVFWLYSVLVLGTDGLAVDVGEQQYPLAWGWAGGVREGLWQ